MFSPGKKPTRLGQWDGRRHSTRLEAPVLTRLWQKPVLLRIGVVLVTAAVVAVLVYAWGPAVPYRVGEVYPTDLRVRVPFKVENQPQTNWRREMEVDSLPNGEIGDPIAREEARRSILPVFEEFPRGMPLVRR